MNLGTPLEVAVKTSQFQCRGTGLISGQNITHAEQCSQKNKPTKSHEQNQKQTVSRKKTAKTTKKDYPSYKEFTYKKKHQKPNFKSWQRRKEYIQMTYKYKKKE